MKLDVNVTDFFKLPAKIIFSVAIATGIILFLPENILSKLYMLDFRTQYGFVIGLLFTISISLSFVSFCSNIYYYFKNKYNIKKFKSTQKERLQNLDTYQKAIVYGLFKEDNHTAKLPLNDGGVKWLKHNLIIIETMNQYIVDDLNNALFPYMLQPWVVDELQKDQKLLDLFHSSHIKINEKY